VLLILAKAAGSLYLDLLGIDNLSISLAMEVG
jgi:hypothetical protein